MHCVEEKYPSRSFFEASEIIPIPLNSSWKSEFINAGRKSSEATSKTFVFFRIELT
jgi:hypothetical protein